MKNGQEQRALAIAKAMKLKNEQKHHALSTNILDSLLNGDAAALVALDAAETAEAAALSHVDQRVISLDHGSERVESSWLWSIRIPPPDCLH